MSNWIEQSQFDFAVDEAWRDGAFWTEEERSLYVKNVDQESRDALVVATRLEDWNAADAVVSVVIDRALDDTHE